ncbi:MAG TPA: sugar-binding domain-containing protein [Chthoniobacterales bacterium]|nr:sugar-binding domain-containing protein [Chthoniobacterales bacterium]
MIYSRSDVNHLYKFRADVQSTQERVTRIQLPRLPRKPVTALAGGEHKAEAELGALRGRSINGLVTDETCARAILARE